MANVYILPNGQLVDKVIEDIQTGLSSSINWLDNVYGRAERLVEYKDGKEYYTPGVYVPWSQAGYNDYLPMYPDSKKGNYCFFYQYDPQEINWIPRGYGVMKIPIAIIFWFDLNSVNDSLNVRNVESLKAEVLNAINFEILLSSGHLSINKSYNLNENIFRDFSVKELDNQYLMHPYGGFRLEGELFVDQPCYNVPPVIPRPL